MHATILLALTLAITAPAPKAAPKKEPTLVGKWMAESYVYRGKPIDVPDGAYTTFSADGTVTSQEGQTVEARVQPYTVDAKKSPAEVDLLPTTDFPGLGTLICIYKIEGDILTMCYSAEKRPTKFESPENEIVYLVTLKRAKEEK